MSFTSFLKAVGNDFKKSLPIALRVAQVADIGISIGNPALGGIIGTSIQTVLNVEQKAQAVAAITGSSVSGPTKLAEAVNTLYPAFEQIFGQYGVKIDNSHVTNYVNAIVAALNAFPALPAPQPAPTQVASNSSASIDLAPAKFSISTPVISSTAVPATSVQATTAAPDPVLANAG